MRIIIDVDNRDDAQKCLSLVLKLTHIGGRCGYWSSDDPDFTATYRANKNSFTIRGRRKKAEELR